MERRLAKNSFAKFVARLSLEPEPARHHKLIIDKLEQVASGKIKRLMIFMPPGSAKSFYASIMFPAWYLAKNPTKNIIASSYTAELAEKFGRRVRNIIASEEYKEVAGVSLSKDSQAAGRWALEPGGEYYAVGVGGSVTGFRADGGIIDDPVKGHEEAESEIKRQRIKEWFKSDFWTRLKPDAFLIIIMTRWHVDDLAGWQLAEAECGGEQWEVLSLPAEATLNDPLGREPGEILWPEWYRPEMIAQAKRDTRLWNSLYQQTPVALSGNEFKAEWIQYFNPLAGIVLGECNLWILVDPANEKKAASDYTAMVVMALAPDNNYYIMEIVRDKLNPTERIKKVMEFHKKWNKLAGKPPQVAYEKYGMMTDIHYLQQEQDKQGYRFSITEVGGQMKKEDRIRRLIPIFQQKRIYLPVNCMYVNIEGKTTETVMEFVQHEYEPFPFGTHDDVLDATARIFDVDAMFPMLQENYKQNTRLEYEEIQDTGWEDF